MGIEEKSPFAEWKILNRDSNAHGDLPFAERNFSIANGKFSIANGKFSIAIENGMESSGRAPGKFHSRMEIFHSRLETFQSPNGIFSIAIQTRMGIPHSPDANSQSRMGISQSRVNGEWNLERLNGMLLPESLFLKFPFSIDWKFLNRRMGSSQSPNEICIPNRD